MKRLIAFWVLMFLSQLAIALPAIKEGHCYISAPAIHGMPDDYVVGHLCQLVKNGERYTVQFLEQGGWLSLEIVRSGKVKIIDSSIGMLEIGRKAEGYGQLNDNGEIRGEVIVTSFSAWLNYKKNKSEWFLRPATESEIRMGIASGLKLAIRVMPISKKKEFINGTLPDIEMKRYLNVGARGGYAESDIPDIYKMLEEGKIFFDDKYKVTFRKPLANPEVKTDPQLAPVVELSVEDLKKKLNIPKLSPDEQRALKESMEASQNAAQREFDELQAKRIAEMQGLKQVDPEKNSNPPQERKFDPWLWGPAIVFVLLVISLALSFRRKQRS